MEGDCHRGRSDALTPKLHERLKEGSSLFCSAAGAPHPHLSGHSVTIILVYSGKRSWLFQR